MKKQILIFGIQTDAQEYSRNFILIQAIVKSGFNVKYCTVNWGLASSESKPIIKIAHTVLNFLVRWIILITKYFKTKSKGIIFVPYPGHIDVIPALLLAKLFKTKVIFDAFIGLYDTIITDRHLFSKKSYIAKLILIYEKIILSLVDFILIDTDDNAELLTKTFGLDNKKIITVPVGIDEKIWFKSPIPPLRDEFRVAFWTTFIPLHGVEIVAMAAKRLEYNDPKISFTVIGTGQTINKFQKILNELRITNIKWIKDFVPIRKIREVIEDSHCCLGVFGTEEKTKRVIPYKVYQALASGRPVITSRTKAILNFFSNNLNVILVTPGDYIELSHAIKELAENNYRLNNIAKAGHDVYKQRLSNDRIVIIMRKLIVDIYS